MTRLTRRYRFSASHRLHSPAMTEAENNDLYGKCNNPFGHGHDYVLEVTVRGPVDAGTGRVVKVGELDRFVESEVIQYLDHKDMNSDVADFRDLVATTENLSVLVEQRLRRSWQGTFGSTQLDSIRLQETKRNLFELKDL